MLSVYWVADRFETDPIKAKLLEARAELLGYPRETAFIGFAMNFDGDPPISPCALDKEA